MIIRPAAPEDISAVAAIFSEVHDAEAAGITTTGWLRDIYPVRATAEAALNRGDLFVQEDKGTIVGTAVINQIQVDVYEGAPWKHPAEAEQVMVLHTLAISPKAARQGYGKQFVAFYEDYARKLGCRYLRMDTNARNLTARAMYRKLGYQEIGIVPCVFNGIPDVSLVLLEKKLT